MGLGRRALAPWGFMWNDESPLSHRIPQRPDAGENIRYHRKLSIYRYRTIGPLLWALSSRKSFRDHLVIAHRETMECRTEITYAEAITDSTTDSQLPLKVHG
jgi:hypothetical protein